MAENAMLDAAREGELTDEALDRSKAAMISIVNGAPWVSPDS